MLVNEAWLTRWPLAAVEVLRGGTSDHAAIITRLRDIPGSRRPFHIYNT